jgi:hypothetical protein
MVEAESDKSCTKDGQNSRKCKFNENHPTYEELTARFKLPSLKLRRTCTLAINIETVKTII